MLQKANFYANVNVKQFRLSGLIWGRRSIIEYREFCDLEKKGRTASAVRPPAYAKLLAAAVTAAVVAVVAATVRAITAEAVAAAEKDQNDDDDPGAASAKTVAHCLAPPFVYST